MPRKKKPDQGPRRAYEFIQVNSAHWEHRTSRRSARQVVLKLEHWLEKKGIAIQDLTGEHLNTFLIEGHWAHLSERARANYLGFVRFYVVWLLEAKAIQFHQLESVIPDFEFKRERDLPKVFNQYLELRKSELKRQQWIVLRSSLIRFHLFIKKQSRDLTSVSVTDLQGFKAYLVGRRLAKSTRTFQLIRA